MIARLSLRCLCVFAVVGGCPLFGAEPAMLWDPATPLPRAVDMPVIAGTRFAVIKPYEFKQDGYRFLHGVGLAWHKNRLFASFGHNKGGENTGSEEARGRVSDDGGRTWGETFTIDSGEKPDLAVSHGVFLSHGGQLHAFMGVYYGTMKRVHTRGYLLDEATGRWAPLGVVVERGFWPMQEPQRMEDGNWIMAGISARGDASAGGVHPPAVAISRGDDLTTWDLVVIPVAEGLGVVPAAEGSEGVWGESTVITQGRRITNIARYGAKALALVATSDDYGRTWTPSQPSNLPMTTSKPYAGRLSSGEPYLICTTTADSGSKRTPLTIALGPPGASTFSRVLVIRRSEHAGEVESHPGAQLSYPYAIEHEGQLYVGYSNSGGGVGRVGEGRQLWNNNSGELAVIPVAALRAN
jgi:hypothetical protein